MNKKKKWQLYLIISIALLAVIPWILFPVDESSDKPSSYTKKTSINRVPSNIKSSITKPVTSPSSNKLPPLIARRMNPKMNSPRKMSLREHKKMLKENRKKTLSHFNKNYLDANKRFILAHNLEAATKENTNSSFPIFKQFSNLIIYKKDLLDSNTKSWNGENLPVVYDTQTGKVGILTGSIITRYQRGQYPSENDINKIADSIGLKITYSNYKTGIFIYEVFQDDNLMDKYQKIEKLPGLAQSKLEIITDEKKAH